MEYLADGTVVPTGLGTRTMGAMQDSGVFSNVEFRVGEVKEAIPPSSKRSRSKKFWEYDVLVQHRTGGGTGIGKVYANCALKDGFGGVGDTLRYTLRADPQSTVNKGSLLGVGNKVLILCINGEQTSPVIIAGYPDNRRETTEAEGHHLEFEFNGVQFRIADDGSMELVFRGKTDANGKLSDKAKPDAEGTTIKIDANGSLTAATPKEDQSLTLDHANKKVALVAGDHTGSIRGKWDYQVGGNVTWSTGGSCSLTATNRVNITSAGVTVGAGTDAWLMGTTYRAAETALHTTLIGGLTALGVQLGVAGVALNGAAVVSPGPAAPFLTAAGVALNTAVANITAMVGGITSFEAGSGAFLSKKNTHD